MEELKQRAQILTEALPYIRKFHGSTVVIKYGGSAMLGDDLERATMLDVVLLRYVGIRPVVVHGGGPQISEMTKRLGMAPTFVQGMRVTDEATMDVVEMVLAGRVNKAIVTLIDELGGKAVGLSGKDAAILRARKRTARTTEGDEVDLGLVGEIEQVDTSLLVSLTDDGFVPVLCPIALGPNNETYNVNADHVAGELAAALKAEKLIMLTDVRGIMEDPSDEDSLISSVTVERAHDLIDRGIVSSGMIPKVFACMRAIAAGVPRAHIIDGRIPHAVLMELFTDAGIGTMIIGEAAS